MIPLQKQTGGFIEQKQGFSQQQNIEQVGHQNIHMQGVQKPPFPPHSDMKSPEGRAELTQKAGFQGSHQGLSFSNPFGVQSQQAFGGMTRSYMKPTGEDIGAFKKEMLIKFHEVNRALSEHGQLIQQLKQSSLSSSTISSSFDFKADTINSDMLRNLRKDFEFDQQSLTNRIMHEIESLRSEISERFLRKTEFESNLTRFESRLSDTFSQRKDVMKDFNDLRDRNAQECRNIYEFFKKEIEANIHHIHEANRLVFNKIEKDMIEIRQHLQTHRADISRLKINTDNEIKIFTSSKKFYDPRIVKYREFVQKVSDKSYEKPGDQIMINEVTYYLDRDGYLLDSHSNYLVDQNNQQILLEQKHLNILKFYSLLQ